MTIRSTTIVAGLLASAALPAAARAEEIATVPIAGTRLDVASEAAVTRAPDIATVTAGVVTQATGASAALADNARRMTAAVAALRRAGVADRDVRTASLGLQPQYRYADNQPPVLTGYQASNTLTVRFRDVTRAGPILDALVAQGVNQIGGPDFSVEDPSAALDEARTQAIASARARAVLYARATGMSVARIVAISETGGSSPPEPMARNMIMVTARKAATALAPGEEKIGVTLNVTFELR